MILPPTYPLVYDIEEANGNHQAGPLIGTTEFLKSGILKDITVNDIASSCPEEPKSKFKKFRNRIKHE